MGFFSEEDWEKPHMDMLDKLDIKTKEITIGVFDRIMEEYISVIDNCESPIEQMLGVALNYAFRFLPDFDIFQQEIITCFDKKYRVDFLVVTGLVSNKINQFVIECDGHDFHEKTKLQVKRDRQRDRHLTASGHHVLRFTGSEIWADPHKCAREARSAIIEIINRSS